MTQRRQTVRWNESKRRWMAWVRFPDGSRRKVERAEKSDAEADLNELLAQRAAAQEPVPRRERLATFNEVIDDWMAAGCPKAAATKSSRRARPKSRNTIKTVRYLLDGYVRPVIGRLWVERTSRERVEDVFAAMASKGYATSTIDHAWVYLNQACLHAQRHRRIKRNPVADVLLPEARPARQRKSLTLEQAKLLLAALPDDQRPALWVTGLTVGLRPGELSGLRWPYVHLDDDEPSIAVTERAYEEDKRYVGQAEPKTKRKGNIGLHPLTVAALCLHRDQMKLLGLYDPEGFVFCTRNKTPIGTSNLRRDFKHLCARAGIPGDWTTYELRHSFVSLIADQLDDLSKVADLAGHSSTRTTEGYRHAVRAALPHAADAWDLLLTPATPKRKDDRAGKGKKQKRKADKKKPKSSSAKLRRAA